MAAAGAAWGLLSIRSQAHEWAPPDTVDWTAPELLPQVPQAAHTAQGRFVTPAVPTWGPMPSLEADVYALSMVMFEIWSLDMPCSAMQVLSWCAAGKQCL